MRSLLLVCLLLYTAVTAGEWSARRQKKYTLYYTAADAGQRKEYCRLLNKGIKNTEQFFGHRFSRRFAVYVHPGRVSLDSTWRTDWNMPGFQPECWMVASGVAKRLDLLSPLQWARAACEHQFSDRLKTQQLLTHELVHVYHGQHNASPDFSITEGMDWFIEGLATYVSGQCDSLRLAEVRKAVAEKKTPAVLDKFWTGKLRYGLAGSMVMYIDRHYGREKLIALLSFNKKSEVLTALNISETDLIRGWLKFMSG